MEPTLGRNGWFVVFGGLNGCGKGTQIARAYPKFIDHSRDYLLTLTREPNRLDNYGDQARRALQSNNPAEKRQAMLKYFSRSRGNHTSVLINPALLLPGMSVWTDRYYESTFAFQGAQGITIDTIKQTQIKNCVRVPDLTLIYDVTAKEAARRLATDPSREFTRKFDGKIEFNMRAREIYLSLPERLAGWDDNIVIINGMNSIDQVAAETWSVMKERLGLD